MAMLRGIDTFFRTLVAIAVVPAALIILSATAAAAGAMRLSDRRVHSVYLAFARLALWVGGTELRVNGIDHADEQCACIVVANHESNWDPLALAAGLPHVILRFVVKRQLTRIPVFGHAIRWTGNVTVDRNQSRGDVDRIHAGMNERGKQISMLFFAEGSRSRDGKLKRFKKGAMVTALSHGLPILPVAVTGTRNVWTPGSVRIRRAPVVIEVGTPISVDSMSLEDRSTLRDRVEQAVRNLRNRGYQELRKDGWPAPPDTD